MPSEPIILSINAGSSSLKVSVYKAPSSSSAQNDKNAIADPTELAVCTIEGLTASPVKIKYNRHASSSSSSSSEAKSFKRELEGISNQEDAFKAALETLLEDEGLEEVRQKEDIKYAVHRIVHGGPMFEGPQVLDEEKLKKIEELSDLAPL